MPLPPGIFFSSYSPFFASKKHHPEVSCVEVLRASGYGDRGRRSEGAGRLEIIGAVGAIAPTAGQIATRTVARLEFDVIGTRGYRADDDPEGTIAIHVGRDHSKFDRHRGCGHSLPCELGAGAAAEVDWKLAEGRGKRRAEGHDSDLIQLVGRRAHQL